MKLKHTIPIPIRGTSAIEKIKFYDDLIKNGLSEEELKIVKKRIQRIDTYFNTEATIEKISIIECINEFIGDNK